MMSEKELEDLLGNYTIQADDDAEQLADEIMASFPHEEINRSDLVRKLEYEIEKLQ